MSTPDVRSARVSVAMKLGNTVGEYEDRRADLMARLQCAREKMRKLPVHPDTTEVTELVDSVIDVLVVEVDRLQTFVLDEFNASHHAVISTLSRAEIAHVVEINPFRPAVTSEQL